MPTADVVWMLTFRAADLAEFGGLVDAVADSFELVAPGPRPEPAGPGPEPPSTDLVQVSGPDSSFTVSVPSGWVHHLAGTGSPLLHEQLFPDDVAPSARLDDFLSTLTTGRTRMVAVDPTGWTVIPRRVAVVDEMTDVGPGSTLDQLVEAARQTWVRDGGLLANEGRLTSATGEIGWFAVAVPGGALTGAQYVVPGPTSAWVITVWSPDGTDRSLGDAIASGFTPA